MLVTTLNVPFKLTKKYIWTHAKTYLNRDDLEIIRK